MQALRHGVSSLQKETLLQTTSIMEQQTVLLKRVQRFHEIQHFYMPGFDPRNYTNTKHNDSTDSNILSTTAIENTKLYMPSELSALDHHKFCPNNLASVEDCICQGIWLVGGPSASSLYMVIHEQVQNHKHHQAEEKYLSTWSPTSHGRQSLGFRAAVLKGTGGFEEATWSWRLGG